MANELYPDLDNNFPVSIDDFDKFQDPNIYSLDAINLYYKYFNEGDLDNADRVLYENPQLKTMILDASRLNKIRDAIVSMERFYLSDFQEYIINAIQYCGEYDSTKTYKKFSVVNYGSSTNEQAFMSIQNVPINILPTDEGYWVSITLKGDKGDAGVGLTSRGEWSANTDYVVEDAVVYNNTLYGCNANHTSSDSFDETYWYKIFSAPGKEEMDNVLKEIDVINNTLGEHETVISSLNTDLGEATLIFNDVSVATTLWVDNTTYLDYPKKVDISCIGVTTNYVADVIFGIKESTSGNFAPVSLTNTDTVTIYAKEVPSEDIIIPTIKCEKAVSFEC